MSKVLARVSVPPRTTANSRLSVVVVFTSIPATMAALKQAGALAHQLGACITLVVPQVVSYALPLHRPPVAIDWTERRFRVLTAECPVETSVRICLCRDRLEMLKRMLPARSLIVIGGPKRWWPTSEKHLASQLERFGHEVILVQ
jgi:hypothetical protein